MISKLHNRDCVHLTHSQDVGVLDPGDIGALPLVVPRESTCNDNVTIAGITLIQLIFFV